MSDIKEVNLFHAVIDCTVLSNVQRTASLSDTSGDDSDDAEDLPTCLETFEVYVTAADYTEVQEKILAEVEEGGVIAETLDNFVDFERIQSISIIASTEYNAERPTPLYLN